MQRASVKCLGKHTKYEPTNAEFQCPKCKPPVSTLYICDAGKGVSDDCDMLHMDDFIECSACSYGMTGKAFANRLVKRASLVLCPMCKGKGLVESR